MGICIYDSKMCRKTGSSVTKAFTGSSPVQKSSKDTILFAIDQLQRRDGKCSLKAYVSPTGHSVDIFGEEEALDSIIKEVWL